jgi:hypothetical protein
LEIEDKIRAAHGLEFDLADPDGPSPSEQDDEVFEG